MARADLGIPDPKLSAAPPASRRANLQGAPEPIAALNRVKIVEYAHPWEAREPLVDIRTFCPEVEPVANICPYLRRTVAERLNAAQSSLPPGYKLRVGTALRTLAMQSHGWDNYFKKMQEAHPDWPLSALRRATNKYFAPYDQKAPPGHCTGGAVDVGLLDASGTVLDMTSPTEGWEAAYTWSDRISPEAKANRMRMVEAMLGAGFSNCRDEYWHYSWGDSAWAVRVGETECPYGWAHPPVALANDFDQASAGAGEIETTRDVNGRALHADGFWEWPDAEPNLRIGLTWANGVPVTLWLRSRRPLSATTFYLGDNAQLWEPMSIVDRSGDAYLLHFTPRFDRVYLTDTLPPPKSDESETSSNTPA